jgi:hypothetical protein
VRQTHKAWHASKTRHLKPRHWLEKWIITHQIPPILNNKNCDITVRSTPIILLLLWLFPYPLIAGKLIFAKLNFPPSFL